MRLLGQFWTVYFLFYEKVLHAQKAQKAQKEQKEQKEQSPHFILFVCICELAKRMKWGLCVCVCVCVLVCAHVCVCM